MDTLKKSVLFLLLLTIAQAAHSQSSRTWVSVSGNDGNDCSRATPCRSLAGAFAKTSTGGEIDILDSGDFGSVTLNRTVSVISPGVLGGIQAGSGTAITINAGPNDKIVLRGLIINGLGTGGTGISFVAGGALYVEDCTIYNFTLFGLELIPASGNSRLFVSDSVLRNNGTSGVGGGVLIKPLGAASVNAAVNRVRLESNNFGLRADGGASTAGVLVTVKDGSSSSNINSAIIAVSASAPVQVMVDGTSISDNGWGVRVDGTAATLRFGNTAIHGNGTGMSVANGGQLISYGNNQVQGNSLDGAPTQTITGQ